MIKNKDKLKIGAVSVMSLVNQSTSDLRRFLVDESELDLIKFDTFENLLKDQKNF